jgi:hypothetical protein
MFLRTDNVTDIDPEFAQHKLDEIFAMHEVARDLLYAGAKYDFPEKSDEELWQVVAERTERRRRGKWGRHEPQH